MVQRYPERSRVQRLNLRAGTPELSSGRQAYNLSGLEASIRAGAQATQNLPSAGQHACYLCPVQHWPHLQHTGAPPCLHLVRNEVVVAQGAGGTGATGNPHLPAAGCCACKQGSPRLSTGHTSSTESHRASTRGRRCRMHRSLPSRLKVRCAFSPMTSTRSLGAAPGLDCPPTHTQQGSELDHSPVSRQVQAECMRPGQRVHLPNDQHRLPERWPLP